MEYNNKLCKEKIEINKLRIMKIKKKLLDGFGEFIKLNSPNKLEEFNKLFDDFECNDK